MGRIWITWTRSEPTETRSTGVPSRPLRLGVFQANATAGAQALARTLDPCEKTWVVFKTVVEPVLLRCEPDQDAGRAAVTRDQDLFVGRFPQMARQVVVQLREWNFLHPASPCVRANRRPDPSGYRPGSALSAPQYRRR